MEIIQKTRFLKDIKKLKKRGKNLEKLQLVLEKLVIGNELDAKYKPHPLVGNWIPCWDIHIEPDWLLIYHVDIKANQLILYRTGTHSDIF